MLCGVYLSVSVCVCCIASPRPSNTFARPRSSRLPRSLPLSLSVLLVSVFYSRCLRTIRYQTRRDDAEHDHLRGHRACKANQTRIGTASGIALCVRRWWWWWWR